MIGRPFRRAGSAVDRRAAMAGARSAALGPDAAALRLAAADRDRAEAAAAFPGAGAVSGFAP
jgi:hypothetical protein